MIYAIYTPKGGQGCTVTAAALALSLPGPVDLIPTDNSGDLQATLGITGGEGTTRNVTVRAPGFVPRFGATTIIDCGTNPLPELPDGTEVVTIMVVRACYLALRRAVTHNTKPDHVILIAEPGRSLQPDDITAVLNITDITTIPFDPAVARAVDAGLLAARLPTKLRPLTELAERLTVHT